MVFPFSSSNHSLLLLLHMIWQKWSRHLPEAWIAQTVPRHRAMGSWATASSKVCLSGSAGGRAASAGVKSVSSLVSTLSVKALVTWVTQMAVTYGKHIIFLSLVSKGISLSTRRISRCSRKFLFTEVLSSVKWLTYLLVNNKIALISGWKQTFTVTSTQSSRWRMILARRLPLWLPRIRWNARSAELYWKPPFWSLDIQWPVIARNGYWDWFNQISAVKDTCLSASWKPSSVNRYWIKILWYSDQLFGQCDAWRPRTVEEGVQNLDDRVT